MNDFFEQLHLHVTELPIEFNQAGQPVYRALLQELPFIYAEGSSKLVVYQQLAEQYQAYAETALSQLHQEEERADHLSNFKDLLKYYDGETFDGFYIDLDK